jgi:hypothetical protein
MKMASFWVVSPTAIIALMMEAVQTSETLVNSYKSTWHYNPEDSHLFKSFCFFLPLFFPSFPSCFVSMEYYFGRE